MVWSLATDRKHQNKHVGDETTITITLTVTTSTTQLAATSICYHSTSIGKPSNINHSSIRPTIQPSQQQRTEEHQQLHHHKSFNRIIRNHGIFSAIFCFISRHSNRHRLTIYSSVGTVFRNGFVDFNYGKYNIESSCYF